MDGASSSDRPIALVREGFTGFIQLWRSNGHEKHRSEQRRIIGNGG